jgi:hypothetical protein
LNKNFLNYPLARNPRVKPEWRLEKKTLRAELPGDHRVVFELPASVEPTLKRFPTPFDISVVCALLVQTRIGKGAKITFASYSEILRAMGFAVSSTNLCRLRSSIAFLSVLTIRYARYWFAGKTIKKGPPKYDLRREQPWTAGPYKAGHRGVKRLTPLIEDFSDDEDGIHLTINSDWLRANGTRFVARVDLPLPRDAAAQNIVLCALARRHDKAPRSKREQPEGHSVKLRAFCRKVGLNHSRRTINLRSALDAAAKYFEDHGRSLLWQIENCRLILVMSEMFCELNVPDIDARQKRQPRRRKQSKRQRGEQDHPWIRNEPDSSRTMTAFDDEGQSHQISIEEYEREFGE